MSVNYVKLLLVNEPEQTVTVIFEYDLSWNDARLTWNASDYNGIQGFFVNRDMVWRPDVLPYDCQSISDARDPEVQHVYVNSNGDMTFYSTNVITSVCHINLQKFPFDQQQCALNFLSFNFYSNEQRIVADFYWSFNIQSASNGEWAVTNITLRNDTTLSYGSTMKYDMVTFTIYLQRSSTFYVVLIVTPSFILTFLCVLGLFWSKFDHTDYLEKLGLGFAAILAMCMVLEIAEESVPKTRQLPALSTYIMVNLLLLTAAISIVVMGSKSLDLRCILNLPEQSKYVPSFGAKLGRYFRIVCLVVFPILSIVNLLVLLLNN